MEERIVKEEVVKTRENKGFSLVELIVVIGILAILSAGLLSVFFNMSNWKVNKCVSTIDGGLDKAKVTALSKTGMKFRLTKETDGYHMKIMSGSDFSTTEEDELIANDALTISYTDTKGSTIQITGDSAADSLTLQYDRSSGAFKRISADPDDATKDVYCDGIIIQKTGSSTAKTIKLYYATGKHEIETN